MSIFLTNMLVEKIDMVKRHLCQRPGAAILPTFIAAPGMAGIRCLRT